MGSFRYRAVTSSDQHQSGTIDAADETDAVRQLAARGLFPIAVSQRALPFVENLTTPIKGRALPAGEAMRLLADLGHLVCAGVEVAPALMIVASTASHSIAKQILTTINEQVRKGRALSDALSDLGTLFPPYVLAVIHAGELSGSLGPALSRAAEGELRKLKLRRQLRTAMIYPSCIAAAVIVAFGVLVGVVIPTLETLFNNELQRLPWQTRVLVTFGNAIRDHAIALILLALGLMLAAAIAFKNDSVRRHLERIALQTPIAGSLISSAETARIVLVLSMLTSAGLPMGTTVGLAAGSTRLLLGRDGFSEASVKLREGVALHHALSAIPSLSERVITLVRIGETTGRLSVLLEEASRDAESRVATAIERGLALLAPAMTLLFGTASGFILYAVMTSILSINDLAIAGS